MSRKARIQVFITLSILAALAALAVAADEFIPSKIREVVTVKPASPSLTPEAIARAMKEKAAEIAAKESALWASGSAPGALHVPPGAEAALAKEQGGFATVGGVPIVGATSSRYRCPRIGLVAPKIELS